MFLIGIKKIFFFFFTRYITAIHAWPEYTNESLNWNNDQNGVKLMDDVISWVYQSLVYS